MNYRPMLLDDCQGVEKLYLSCFSRPWSLRSIREMFTVDGYHSIVAVDSEGQIIGYVGMKTVCDEADITNVAVEPSFRRQGIAHELLKALLDEARILKIQSIFLEVRASNVAAITLYGHAGFQECGRRKNYYEDPREDALLMVRQESQ